jgi:hypothetical protein
MPIRVCWEAASTTDRKSALPFHGIGRASWARKTVNPNPPRQTTSNNISTPRPLPMVMYAPRSERADSSLHQSHRIHRPAGSPPSFSPHVAQSEHRFAHPTFHRLPVQTLQKAMQSHEIRRAPEHRRLAQLVMHPQPHLDFPKAPVLITHQIEYRQQLTQRELTLAESASALREPSPGRPEGRRERKTQIRPRPRPVLPTEN